MNLASLAPIVAAATFPIAGAHAAIVPVSQDRYIFQSVGEDFFIMAATGFDPFFAEMTLEPGGMVTSSQTSLITAESVSGSGSVGPDEFFILNSATSYFHFVFEIDQATPYSLTGDLNLGFFGSGIAHFSGPGGDIIHFTSSGEESFSWNESGVLEPGQYTLEVFAAMSISGGLSNYQFSLTIPSPGAAAVALFWVVGLPKRKRSQRAN